MDESVDKKLAARFKEVFDGHQDNGSAEGWALLQQGKRRRRPVPYYYWLSGAAALLLLAAVLFWFAPGTEENSAQKKHQPLAAKKLLQKEQGQEKPVFESKAAPAEKYAAKGAKASQLAEAANNKVGAKEKGSASYNAGNSQSIKENKAPTVATENNYARRYLTAVPVKNHFGSDIIRDDVRTTEIVSAANENALFVAEKNPATKEAFPRTKKTLTAQRPALAILVYAGSQVNYGAQNTRNQARPSAGLQAQYALGKSKRFSVGLAAGYANYQLAYNNGLPPISGKVSAKSAAAAVNEARVSAYSAANTERKRIPSFVNGNSVNTSALNTYSFISASFVNIDRVTASFSTVEIPLSVSWQALNGNTGLSLSAAVHSTLMMHEAYTADIRVSNVFGSVTQTRTEQNEHNFTAFTPLSAAQISVGVTPGGKGRFSIEPFARFPLQNQGIEQLRYGAAGLNVKFRLNSIQSRSSGLNSL